MLNVKLLMKILIYGILVNSFVIIFGYITSFINFYQTATADRDIALKLLNYQFEPSWMVHQFLLLLPVSIFVVALLIPILKKKVRLR